MKTIVGWSSNRHYVIGNRADYITIRGPSSAVSAYNMYGQEFPCSVMLVALSHEEMVDSLAEWGVNVAQGSIDAMPACVGYNIDAATPDEERNNLQWAFEKASMICSCYGVPLVAGPGYQLTSRAYSYLPSLAATVDGWLLQVQALTGQADPGFYFMRLVGDLVSKIRRGNRRINPWINMSVKRIDIDTCLAYFDSIKRLRHISGWGISQPTLEQLDTFLTWAKLQ